MTEIASEELRRAHSRAIRRRAKWRRDYALLSRAIRETKQRISNAYRNNSVDMVAEVQLRALRQAANLAMLDRIDVLWDLRDTAYTYVDKELLQAA
jgi:hypothetical protein